MKANVREWRHVLKLRTSNAAHPNVQQVMGMVLKEFKEVFPTLFGDL
jgi:thymidylate synthase (FAD)